MKRRSQQVVPDDMLLEMEVLAERHDAKNNKIRKCTYAFEHATDPEEKTCALEELRMHAVSEHGLVCERLRKRCWPILLNVKSIVAEERKDGGLANLRFCNDWKRKYHSLVSLSSSEYIRDYLDKH